MAAGMQAKIHVDQFNSLGGLPMALDVGVRSADHLEVTAGDDIGHIAASQTVAVLMPAVNFNLGLPNFADGRGVLDAGAAGRQDRAWALARIAEMRKTLAALDAALPGGDPSLYRRAAEFLANQDAASEDPAIPDRHAEARKAITDYEAALKGFRTLGEEEGA